jgi:hypothetical protein
MYDIIHLILKNFTLTFFIVGIICALIVIYKHRNELTKAFVVEIIFKYFCLWAHGITWVYNGIVHVVWHKMAAGFIGWADSPFQIELGVASLGFGFIGLLAFKKDYGMRLSLVVSTSAFLWGCAIGHVIEMNATGNHAEGNSGVMLWTGILLPVISIILLRLSYATTKLVK